MPAGHALVLTFGQPDGSHLAFSLERVDERAFIEGAIWLVTPTERVDLNLGARNGIEALALANLRDDVRDVVAHGGELCFGDQDFEQMVTVGGAEGAFTASADLPSEDIWDVHLDPRSAEDRQQIARRD